MEQEEAGKVTRNIMSLDVIAASAKVKNFDFLMEIKIRVVDSRINFREKQKQTTEIMISYEIIMSS